MPSFNCVSPKCTIMPPRLIFPCFNALIGAVFGALIGYYTTRPLASVLWGILIVAVVGLFANIAGLLLLSKASHGSLNVKAAFWHIIGDTISSVGVIIAGIIILFAGWTIVDPIIAVIIGVIILWGAVSLI